MVYVAKNSISYNLNNYKLVEMKTINRKVQIPESLLAEKKSWYEINNEMYYFKKRDGYKLFAELFSSILGKMYNFNVL